MIKKITKPFFVTSFYPMTSALMLALTLPNHVRANHADNNSMQSQLNQQQAVSGSVSSSSGPLNGVTITVKENPALATSTDNKGKFSIQAKSGQTLVFSLVGFEKLEQVITSANMSVQLTESNETLNEVVVVGFGTQKKVNLTGAVQAISSKDLQDRPVTNVSTALQGKFAGVTIIQNSGQPGKDGGTIRIRGLGTTNNANPLVLVDGVESSMNNISPNDIENISVLKDGPSAAIYGSKAANGVVLITTKKGKMGDPQLTYSGYAGWQDPTRLPKYMRSYRSCRYLE